MAPSPNHSDQIAAADEHKSKQEEEARSGSGLHLRREAKELALNSNRFALALARLFRIAEGEFSLALLGRWGSGKTSIANLVNDYLQDAKLYKKDFKEVFGDDPKDEGDEATYATVKFNAWRYKQRPELWIWLYESFLSSFLNCNPFVGVLRSIRVGLEKYGIWKTLFTLVLVAGLAVPLMWISLTYQYGLAIFGFSGVIGLIFLVRRMHKSLRRIFDRYGMVTTHREHLGMQALIGEDLKALVTSWAYSPQFKCWQKWIFSATLICVGLIWFSTFVGGESNWLIESLKKSTPNILGTSSGAILNTSKFACLVWILISTFFALAIGTDYGRVDRILLVVDDLDRCHQEEIVDLIDGIKLMIDDEQIGKVVQALVLADDTILDAAIRKRFEGLSEKDSDARLNAAVREHMEKVFLFHVSLPQLLSKNIGELVSVFSKEFGLETSEPSQPHSTKPLAAIKISGKAETSFSVGKQPHGNFVFSTDELVAIQREISRMHKNTSDIVITPRTVRSFLFKYQLARMLLYIERSEFDNSRLASELADAILKSRGADADLGSDPSDSALRAVVRLVA